MADLSVKTTCTGVLDDRYAPVSIKSKSVMKSEDASARVKRRKRCNRERKCAVPSPTCVSSQERDTLLLGYREESEWRARGYNVCLSGGSDISTDDLKKSPHSDSKIRGVGELVRHERGDTNPCALAGRRAPGSAKGRMYFWRGPQPRTKGGDASGADLRVVHRVVSPKWDSHTRWVRVRLIFFAISRTWMRIVLWNARSWRLIAGNCTKIPWNWDHADHEWSKCAGWT